MRNFVCGANKEGYHYINANPSNFTYDVVGDISNVQAGDICPVCGKPLKMTKGIEVGNTFKLGTKYSKALDLHYLNTNNKEEDVWMGSYGIGVGRTMAAVVEQNYDENGIIWPTNIAPFTCAVVLISSKDEDQVRISNELYDTLQKSNVDVLLDDRDERPGVKFKDMELIGIPYRITVGRNAKDGIVELKSRTGDINEEIKVEDVVNRIQELTK